MKHVIDPSLNSFRISVVIPVYNEEIRLPKLFESLDHSAMNEVIVVDCQSQDQSPEIIKKWALEETGRYRRVFVSSARGRARQMNEGAKQASGEILIFLHADSYLPEHSIENIRHAMNDAALVGGAFHLYIDTAHPFLKFVTWIANLRSLYWGLPYGDQAYFVRRSVFERLQGYREIALMEDVDFFRRLKKEGKTVLLKDAVSTSARRWEDKGYFLNSFRNMIFVGLYFLGFSPDQLAKWYYS